MRLLITGALGHIGSKLIHSLKPGQFQEVILLDNMLTQRYSSLFNLPSGMKFSFYEEDICLVDLDKYFKGIDVVIHLAAITDAASTFDKKELVEEVNYLGTQKVTEACMRNKCRLIFPSTTSVYGTQAEIVDEFCSKADLKPQSPYAESKLKAEELLLKLGKEDKLKFVILRLGTIFGISIGMRFHTAVNKFCWQAVLGRPITVWRTALHQKRPYLDLNDALAAMNFVIEKDLFDNSVYNVVTENFTVNDILENIKRHLQKIQIEYVDVKIMNQLSYCVSNARFKKAGFAFRGSIEKGIAETIALLNGASSGKNI